ncbi:triphosphoribosyl-dephospho-CoA synthase [Azospirillum sp. SYSU D00513]|uniref:triphosphoribosyl-dephospho-CoA synthase n=1 Tax=Azospirillum sp. SYSU D00513 TaxID=2812561 RepID=UPI001A95BC54|nr:triphosphoribosyl-dephospho-CoA synthase [Azospirillum sp. SYSU D00513]
MADIAHAFTAACHAELLGLKPGNVHVHAEGHGMTTRDFLRSAEVSAPEIARAGASVGERVLGAMRATWDAVGCNTNLGILLLAAPLAAAAERAGLGGEGGGGRGGLQAEVRRVLAELTVADAEAVFEAIRIASPAGLGEAPEHDVRGAARVTLLDAMVAAKGRDRIAAQYANGYADLFTVGVARARALHAAEVEPGAMAESVFLEFLTAFEDSHVARKFGDAAAMELVLRSRSKKTSVESTDCKFEKRRLLAEWDRELKQMGINPGTSADLTVNSLFALWLEVTIPPVSAW